jgi:hypothetical protein
MATRKPKRTERPVTSLAAFARRVEKITLDWAPGREFDPWFRGHADTDWPLVPGLYRDPYDRDLDEDNYREDFKLRALQYLEGSAREPKNEWEWYFLMQHWGLPTRLLDWTRGALVALYFAVRDKKLEPPRAESNAKLKSKDKPDGDAVVWVLDPWALNEKIAHKRDFLFSASDRGVQSYLHEPFSKKNLPTGPIALEAAFDSKRIAAQRGCFTLHGRTRKALDKYSALKPRLEKIEVARKKVGDIREQLRVLGITETSVFPELSGLTREIKDYWTYYRK